MATSRSLAAKFPPKAGTPPDTTPDCTWRVHTMSEVERLTRELAAVRRNPRVRVPKGRLSDIETKGRTPSIHCLFALAQAYRCDVRKLMGFYGLRG